jgi:hypothetical protein
VTSKTGLIFQQPATGLTPEDLAAQSAIHAASAREQAFTLFEAWLTSARRTVSV